MACSEVSVTRVEIDGATLNVGTTEVRITDTMPGLGSTNQLGQQTGGELFGTFTGSDAETLVSLRNNPTKGTVVIVQTILNNKQISMDEIRVFGTKGKCYFAAFVFCQAQSQLQLTWFFFKNYYILQCQQKKH